MARLEWAINEALHAADAQPLDLGRLACLGAEEQGRLRFVAHPSVRLLRLDHPADLIWRAILTGDDRALATIDPDAGPVHLVVGRRDSGVEVSRLEAPAWRFAERLFAGEPLELALDWSAGPEASPDAAAALADHLAAGRLVSFDLAPLDTGALALAATS